MRDNNDRVALFAHQGFGLAFLSCLLDIPYPQMSTDFDMSHTGVTAIHFKGDGIVIKKGKKRGCLIDAKRHNVQIIWVGAEAGQDKGVVHRWRNQ